MAASHRIADVIRQYLQELLNFPVNHCLDASLEKALEAEKEIRLLFGTNPGSPLLDDLYLGLTDVFNLHPATRRARARHIEPKTAELYSQYVFPLPKVQRRSSLMPSTVYNLEVFQQRWEIFTQGALSKMKSEDWENVIAAGGSVLACLMAPGPQSESATAVNEYFQSPLYASSDIDLFLWGLSPKQVKSPFSNPQKLAHMPYKAEEKMISIYQAVCAATPWYVTCVRKANTISIHTQWPRRPIQIILRLYHSPAEILAGFDVDAACCAYNGKRVWVNPRALTALIRQRNTIDISRRSPSYETRLAKYAERGFEVYIPSLCREQLKPSIYTRELAILPNGLARLLVLEVAYYKPYYYKHLGYILKGRQAGPACVPKDEAIESDDLLGRSEYDGNIGWASIPYGRLWTAERIEKMIKRRDEWMNSPHNERNKHSSNYHRHVFFAGTMQECLGYSCQTCAIIEDMIGSSDVANSQLYFIGALRFLTRNPGRQLLTGSFRPTEIGDWAEEAYVQGALAV